LVARAGRCSLRPLNEADNLLPLVWDEGGPWNFLLELHRLGKTACTLVGFFERGEERREATFPALATAGLVITRDREHLSSATSRSNGSSPCFTNT
jgi:hypothetical protein